MIFRSVFLNRNFKKLILCSTNLKWVITKLGEYLIRKSINKAEVSRRAGISKSRLSELSTDLKTKLRVKELYLIAMTIDVNPYEIFEGIFKGIELPNKNK